MSGDFGEKIEMEIGDLTQGWIGTDNYALLYEPIQVADEPSSTQLVY